MTEHDIARIFGRGMRRMWYVQRAVTVHPARGLRAFISRLVRRFLGD